MTTIRLTPAQRSALECRFPDALDEIVQRVWDRRNRLQFSKTDRDALGFSLIDASNGEDAQANERNQPAEVKKYAARAARSLSCIADKVLSS